MITYKFTDAEGVDQPVTSSWFTTDMQRIDTVEEGVYALGAALGTYVLCPAQHRVDDLAGYDDQLLARWKITRTVVADPPPPVVRPDLPKSLVTQRLIDLNHISAVMTVLRSDDGLYALWFAPDWKTVYKDDERVIPILQAAGLTAGMISQVLA